MVGLVPSMYKSRLQELCQRRHWALPQYTASRDGPDHSPLFRATVTVNGAAFHSPDDSCSSKQAQDRAAQVAFEQLSAEDPPTAPSWPLPVALGEFNRFSGILGFQVRRSGNRSVCGSSSYGSRKGGILERFVLPALNIRQKSL